LGNPLALAKRGLGSSSHNPKALHTFGDNFRREVDRSAGRGVLPDVLFLGHASSYIFIRTCEKHCKVSCSGLVDTGREKGSREVQETLTYCRAGEQISVLLDAAAIAGGTKDPAFLDRIFHKRIADMEAA
jgi:hypothetical protein